MWRQLVQQWLVVMATIGLTTVVVMFGLPRYRRWIPLVVPLVLGVACSVVALLHLTSSGRSVPNLLWGAPAADLLDWPPLAGVVVGLSVGLLGAWGAFHAERALLRLRRPSRAPGPGLPLGGATLDLPGRAESMTGVARVAERPVLFLGVSAASAVGEELLFRGSMLTDLPWADPGAVTLVVGLQAVLFAGTHLAFGWRTVAAKVLLGLALGVGALLGGLVLAALIPHLAYQAGVLRQFRPIEERVSSHA